MEMEGNSVDPQRSGQHRRGAPAANRRTRQVHPPTRRSFIQHRFAQTTRRDPLRSTRTCRQGQEDQDRPIQDRRANAGHFGRQAPDHHRHPLPGARPPNSSPLISTRCPPTSWRKPGASTRISTNSSPPPDVSPRPIPTSRTSRCGPKPGARSAKPSCRVPASPCFRAITPRSSSASWQRLPMMPP
jgi:hypothetical protein